MSTAPADSTAVANPSTAPDDSTAVANPSTAPADSTAMANPSTAPQGTLLAQRPSSLIKLEQWVIFTVIIALLPIVLNAVRLTAGRTPLTGGRKS